MKENFKICLQQHFFNKKLTESQVEQLVSLQYHLKPEKIQQDFNQPKTHQKALYSILSGIGIIGTLALTCMIIFLNISQIPITEKIAKEVAKNHIKLKPLEIQGDSIEVIQKYFTELDFSLINSKRYNNKSWQLKGGRYCSIQGFTAAQLRYKDSSNHIHTLYQVEHFPELLSKIELPQEQEKPLIHYAKGLTVKIWNEKGLLLVSVDSTQHLHNK